MLTRRLALTVAVAALAAGCARGEPSGRRSAHARVACVGCHRGATADSGQAAVPDAACASRRCHPDGGPDTARVAMVTFSHRRHGAGGAIAASCAACHTHQTVSSRGRPVLKADASSCALCHFAELAGGREAPCATCHGNPRHTRLTSQGVPLAHAAIADARVPCTRCHYQLLDGTGAVAEARCSTCHRGAAATAALPADSAHARHAGLTCRACHEPVRHRVVAMSTSVELRCSDCHAARHRRPIPSDTAPSSSCADCHTAVHQEEQRLVLGLLPGEELRPSTMFMGGVTCRSCHVAPGSPGPRAGVPLVATEAACTGCHGPAWTGILARWRRGYARREGWVTAYIADAERALGRAGAPAHLRARLREARGLLAFARAAGPLHNLPMSDRIMRHALALIANTYTIAGLDVPAPPELGPPVAAGSCIGCHYGIEEAPAARDFAGRRTATHADHVLRAQLSCDACHAAGAPPPGLPDTLWMDTLRTDRGGRARARGPRQRGGRG